MKSALAVVLFRLFTIGVFVDGKEASNVLVMKGDSVTLKSGVTNVQKIKRIEWRFNGSRIDKFVNRLQLDSQTGDLKISNINTTDSGLYKVKISSTDGSPPEMEFNVKVLPTGAAKAVILNEGDSITLRTDLTEIQRDDVIRWWFEQQKSPVAVINRRAGIFKIYDDPDERFRDRLTLNNQTGSLNITNTRTEHAGLYEAEISSSKYTIHKSFNVTVRGSDLQSGSGLSSGGVAGSFAVGVAVGAAVGVAVGAAVGAAGVVMYYRRKNSEQERQRENGGNLKQKTDDHATAETKLDDPLKENSSSL